MADETTPELVTLRAQMKEVERRIARSKATDYDIDPFVLEAALIHAAHADETCPDCEAARA